MKSFLLYFFLIFTALNATAQPPADGFQNPKKQEKIQALYYAYITQKLQLTPDEAKQFWPLHEQYQREMIALNNNPNDLDRQQGILNLKRKYQPIFEKVIGSERSNRFYRQNDEFRDKLTQRLKEMRQERKAEKADGVIRPGPGGGGFRRGNGLGGRRENMIPPKLN